MWKLKALGEAFVGLQTWLGFFDDDISNQLLTFNFLLLLSSTAMARKIRVFFFFLFFTFVFVSAGQSWSLFFVFLVFTSTLCLQLQCLNASTFVPKFCIRCNQNDCQFVIYFAK